jgi:hypothetical protein
MLSFQSFVASAARSGKVVNLLFEQQVFALVGLLDRIAKILEQAGIPYELVGGMAVFVHVNRADQTAARNTKDIDLLIRRVDLQAVVNAAQAAGFVFRHAAGVDMLLWQGDKSNPILFVFAGEKTRQEQPHVNPELAPVRETLYGSGFWIIPIADLVKMKLSSNRLRDQVQIQDMDAVGLINSQVESMLPADLRDRLTAIRSQQ